jgi:hypothetical protein
VSKSNPIKANVKSSWHGTCFGRGKGKH